MFNSERKATVILVATTMIAALGWIFSKETIQGLPPFGFIGLAIYHRLSLFTAIVFPTTKSGTVKRRVGG